MFYCSSFRLFLIVIFYLKKFLFLLFYFFFFFLFFALYFCFLDIRFGLLFDICIAIAINEYKCFRFSSIFSFSSLLLHIVCVHQFDLFSIFPHFAFVFRLAHSNEIEYQNLSFEKFISQSSMS